MVEISSRLPGKISITRSAAIIRRPSHKTSPSKVYSSIPLAIKIDQTEDFTFINDPDFLSPDGGDTRDEKVTEKILRGTVDWAFTQTQSLEVGVEGTINTLDKTQVFFDTVNGARVDLSVFNADQVVTEDRVEAFGSHTWRPSSKWEIETGLAVEFSWLDQLGSDVDTNRTFKFAKPSLDVWYNAKEATQVFVLIAPRCWPNQL